MNWWQYIGLSVLDSLTAPYLYIGAGLGVIFSTLTFVALVWGGIRPAYRHLTKIRDGRDYQTETWRESGYFVSGSEFETQLRNGHWLRAEHRDQTATFVFYVVNEDTVNTEAYTLSLSQSVGLHRWMDRRLYKPQTPPSTHTEATR